MSDRNDTHAASNVSVMPASAITVGDYAVFDGGACRITRITRDGELLTFHSVNLFDSRPVRATRSDYEEIGVPAVKTRALRAGFDNPSLPSDQIPLHLIFRAVEPFSSSEGAGKAGEAPVAEPLDEGMEKEIIDAVGEGKEVVVEALEAVGRRKVVEWSEKKKA